MTRVHNYGAAWSSFFRQDGAAGGGNGGAAGGGGYLLLRRIVQHPLGVAFALLILGGGVGNIIDRIANGYVVDMFDLLLFDYPRVQSGRLLRGGGRDSGRGVLPGSTKNTTQGRKTMQLTLTATE